MYPLFSTVDLAEFSRFQHPMRYSKGVCWAGSEACTGMYSRSSVILFGSSSNRLMSKRSSMSRFRDGVVPGCSSSNSFDKDLSHTMSYPESAPTALSRVTFSTDVSVLCNHGAKSKVAGRCTVFFLTTAGGGVASPCWNWRLEGLGIVGAGVEFDLEAGGVEDAGA